MIANNEEVETVDHFSMLFKNNYSKVKYFAYVLLKSNLMQRMSPRRFLPDFGKDRIFGWTMKGSLTHIF